VTLACLPLLVVDMVSASPSSGATEDAAANASVPDPSLVVSASPSIESTSTTEAPTTTVALSEPGAVAPSTTVAARAPSTASAAPAAPAAPTTTAPRPVATTPPMDVSDAAFLACVRHRESGGDYGASDPSGTYLGAYQIYQGGWDSSAGAIGRSDLIGIPPNRASAPDQDTIALAMLHQYGRSPWGGYCG
jgi:hypothetical protein